MIKPIYNSFEQASGVINDLLAVDYFLAKEVVNSVHYCKDQYADLTLNITLPMNSNDYDTLFHMVIALSQFIQQGHTCLPIKNIAGSRFASSTDVDGNIDKQGYAFPTSEQLESLLAKLPFSSENNSLLVVHQGCLYLRRYYLFEQELSIALNNKMESNNLFSLIDIVQTLATLFPENNIAIDGNKTPEIDWQKVSVANALNKNFSVIAGGPGTGKTYTVTKLLAALVMLEQQTLNHNTPEMRFALIAPTGKAAQRLSESILQAVNQFKGTIKQDILDKIPTEALTIHRLLGYIPNSPNFRYNEDNQLPIDFLLIDEASMIDLALLTRVFRALPAQTKIVLLGDADQLPSVAVGNVLADIAPRPHPGYSAENYEYLQQVLGNTLLSKKMCVNNKPHADHLTFLMKSRRFDGEGGIGKLAKSVIAGEANHSWALLEASTTDEGIKSSPVTDTSNELSLIKPQQTLNSNLSMTDTVLLKANQAILVNFIQQFYQPLFQCNTILLAFETLHQFRILCATRKGLQGVNNINEQVIDYFQKNGSINTPAHKSSRQSTTSERDRIGTNQAIYHAMPILISENHHKLGIYNGDIGIIWQNHEGQLMAMFEDSAHESGIKTIIPSRLPSFEPVYAMTIHKTQGSEFANVLMMLPEQSDNKLLSRELLYTGITRAKKHITIASKENVWRKSVESQVVRFSNLAMIKL